MRFLILLVFACPFDNVWEIQPFPLIIGTHDHSMIIIDDVRSIAESANRRAPFAAHLENKKNARTAAFRAMA